MSEDRGGSAARLKETASLRLFRIGLLRASTALTTGLVVITMTVAAAEAQTYTGNYVTSGPFSGGTQYFHHRSRIDASAANAVSGGTQWFYNSSGLDASAANAVSGGYQYFDGNSSLNASASNAVTGWGQDFWGSSSLNATAANAISGTQKFYETSALNASAANAISGGYQWFYDTSKLNASVSSAISAGIQRFYDTSALNASAANAISGGTQWFWGSSSLNASAANAISGGNQWFHDTSKLNASAANAISRGQFEFRDSTSLNASVANAVSGGTFRFYDTSTLNLSAANAVSGGNLMFFGSNVVNASAANAITGGFLWIDGNSTLNASVAHAVNGGTQGLRGSSTLNAAATNAVSGVIELWGSSTVQVQAANALTNGAEIILYSNDNALVLNGFSTIVGQISRGGVIQNTGATDATLTADSSVRGDSYFWGVIKDGGTGKLGLVKTGAGTLKLGGVNTYTGTTLINGGRLLVNGSIAGSTLTVGSGGTLGGIGTVGATTVAAGGTVAPGNSIGTLRVAGNFTFAAGAAYEVETDPASTSSDRIAVTGTAFLNGGSVVHVGQDGPYRLTSSYTILTAVGGISGKFGPVTENLSFLDATLSYGANDVTLTLTRNGVSFATVGQTGNQDAGAATAEQLGAGNAVHDTILGLDAAGARAAFDALSGEIHASAKTALIEDSRFVRLAAMDRVREAFDDAGASSAPVTAYGSGMIGWGHVFGAWGAADGDGNAAELRRETGGLLVGVDGIVADAWRLGVLAGYSRMNFDSDLRASSGESDNIHLGLYGGTQWGQFGLRAGAAHSWHDIETNRWVSFPGFVEQLTDDYNSRTAQVFGELGYRIDGPVTFEPFAGLAYVNLHTDGYAENGGAAALSGSSSDTDVTFSTLGLRASTSFTFAGFDATASGMLGWRHAFGETTPLAMHAFAAGSDPFVIGGVPISGDTAVIEAGLDLGVADNASLNLSYSGQLASDVQDHGVKANLSVRF